MSFGILNVGRTGMAAHSFGQHVASNNATNVATEGYSRRSANIENIPPPPNGGGGARAMGSRRIIDPHIERRLLGAHTGQGEAEGRMQVLGVLDSVFSDADGNLAEAIGAFEAALSDFASYPSEPGARTALLGAADALGQAFRRSAADLETAREIANDRIVDEVTSLNDKTSRIAALGREIAKAELHGREASDLRDKRDQLLREVADQAPIKVIEHDTGQVTVLLGGSTPLVDEDGNAYPLTTVLDPGTGDVQVHRVIAGQDQDISARFDDGKIGGIFAARDGALATAQADLDQLAFDMAGAYNAVHNAGFGLDGVGGRNLFEPAAAVAGAASAFDVSVDVASNPDALAAATDPTLVPGDNRNALDLLALADAPIASGGTQTAIAAFTSIVADAGVAGRDAQGRVERSGAALLQVQALRDSISGVSSDEEMVNLMEAQRAYQATLRVIQTADEMLNEIVNLKR